MLNCSCSSTKEYLVMFMRVSVGLALALIGLDHIINMAEFAPMVTGGLGFLTPVGPLLVWIVALLQLVGGLWFAYDASNKWSGLLVGLGLALIAVGMPLQTLLGKAPLTDVMPAAQNALMWMLFAVVTVAFCCGDKK